MQQLSVGNTRIRTLSPQTTRKSSLQGLWLMDRTVNGTEVVLRPWRGRKLNQLNRQDDNTAYMLVDDK